MHIITYKKYYLALAAFIMLGALTIVLTLGFKPSIEFTGGSLTEVTYTTLPSQEAIESAVREAGFSDATVRYSKSDVGEGYLVSTKDLSEEERVILADSLTTLSDGGEISRFTSIGPVIGQELKDKAFWAVGAILLLTICYVAFAFAGIGWPVSSWVYGFITIFVLLHDILVPMAAMSLLGYFLGAQADVLFVTVLLTILGYSVNDTIVIFDRIREKLREFRTEHKKMVKVLGGVDQEEVTHTLTKPFPEIVGQAIMETMARSINTSLTVVFALVALYFFGSAVTQTFILILLVGVIAGAYSSIFIASPLLVLYEEWSTKRQAENPKK
jgi:preprotein translocase subunit SecF